ncbi:MAG: S41 family peptidase [Planctomycetia bacterium]|nr:S41 family peptidase [Planctomycetia bacterium]
MYSLFLAIVLGVTQDFPTVVDAPAVTQVEDSRSLESVLEQGIRLETAHRWAPAQEWYDKAMRQFPDNVEIQKRYNRAKMFNDVHRRFLDTHYVATVRALTPEQQRKLLFSVLNKYEAYYVRSLAPSEICHRGLFGLDIALSDVEFRQHVLPNVAAAEIAVMQKYLREIMQSNGPQSGQEAVLVFEKVSRQCEQKFGAPASFFLMECLAGFVTSLDQYSSLLIPTQYRDMMSSIEGNFVGLGVELQTKNEQTVIIRVISGSPAKRAGVRDGDVLLEVDGNATQGRTLDQVSRLLQGKRDTSVKLRLQAPGESPRTLSVLRSKVIVPCIERAEIVPNSNGTAYVQILNFQNNTAKELDRALWKLHAQGMRRLILDLRGNPGGLMRSAIDAADLFLSDGVIVSTVGNQGAEKNVTYNAKTYGTWRVPLVVLIDERSASASEIFAGAIHDHQRGKIIGIRSYGKGTVQGIFELDTQTHFGVKLTTSQFFSPKGKRYHRVGVTPDLEVHQAAKPTLQSPMAEAPISPQVGASVEERLEKDAVLSTAVELFRVQ